MKHKSDNLRQIERPLKASKYGIFRLSVVSISLILSEDVNGWVFHKIIEDFSIKIKENVKTLDIEVQKNQVNTRRHWRTLSTVHKAAP